jgi:hypothetical protein
MEKIYPGFVFDGLVFETTRDRCVYIGLTKAARQMWLNDNSVRILGAVISPSATIGAKHSCRHGNRVIVQHALISRSAVRPFAGVNLDTPGGARSKVLPRGCVRA